MARGTGCNGQDGSATTKAKPRRGRVPALVNLSYDQIQVSKRFAARDEVAPWKLPNDFEQQQAREFADLMAERGLDLDPIVAYRLLKQRFETSSPAEREWAYRSWLFPHRGLIQSPEKSCPGMDAAGAEIAEALKAGTKIAVFCDYDVDGTAAGAALSRGLAPYAAPGQLTFGYADAKDGFGLTNEFVEEAAASGAKYLITLDCGSGQVDQARLAQKLGLKLVVVDHHTTESSKDNPAEYHLNPHLYEEAAGKKNTGAQLAWKLAAAVQAAAEPDGKTRPEHWHEALYLAGAGMLADMGDPIVHENRAFLWCAHDHAPAGFAELAERLGEDPTVPGQTVLTQAVLNLPKRSPLVSAADSGFVLRATSREEAAPVVDRMLASYEAANGVRKQMVEAALIKAGGKSITDTETGELYRPNPDEPIATIMLEPEDLPGHNLVDYVGYTGPAAQRISGLIGKPVLIFIPRGTDEFGQTLYKFSGRDGSKGDGWLGIAEASAKLGPKPSFVDNWNEVDAERFVKVEEQSLRLSPFIYGSSKKCVIGELIADEALQQACMIKKRNESGEIDEAPSLGGHASAPVVSGACTAENIDAVKAAVTAWAQKSASEFSKRTDGKRGAANFQPTVAVDAVLTLSGPDPTNEKYQVGTLDLGNGVVRDARFPSDLEAPVGRSCQWLLKLGKSGAYYLRTFHDAEAAPEAVVAA
jgi:hypothetical protein